MKFKSNFVFFFCATVLLFVAVILYLYIHGTKELIVFQLLHSIIPVIPLNDGHSIGIKFISNYLVDILWMNSFMLYLLILRNKSFFWLALLLSLLFEFIQLFFSMIGTFDFIDIFIYVSISLFYWCRFYRLKK